jgi:hypothetical protein
MVLKWHMPFYREIFVIPGFLQPPILTFGHQGIEGIQSDAPPPPNPFIPRVRRFLTSDRKLRRLTSFVRGKLAHPVPMDFKYQSLTDLLRSKGYPVTTLDYFDSRADLRYDMNQPLPAVEYSKYGTFIDIGCLEHLFDTAACLENCMRMVRRDGHYLLHTPINGYFGHGLHVFNPQGLIDCFVGNGFKIVYLKYSTIKGKTITDPSKHDNVILWLVAKKEKEVPVFVCPQQTVWATDYYPQPIDSATAA